MASGVTLADAKGVEWVQKSTNGGQLVWHGSSLLEVSHNSAGEPAVEFPAKYSKGILTFETTLPSSGEGLGAIATLTHKIASPDHIWLPHLSPYHDTVIGDHAFRSPAIVLADAKKVLVLIPDVDDVRKVQNEGLRVWMDYDHPNQSIRIAVGAYDVEHYHVAYVAKPLQYKGQKVKVRVHVLTSDRQADIENPYGLVSRWMWKRWGHAGYEQGGSQRAPFTSYAKHVVNWAFSPEPKGWGDSVWQEFTIGGKKCGAPAFIVDVAQHPSVPMDQRRWREQRSVWNQAWFSNQRTANGLLRYARSINSTELERRAQLMTQVALCAPQTDGLFAAVLGQRALDKLRPTTTRSQRGRNPHTRRSIHRPTAS